VTANGALGLPGLLLRTEYRTGEADLVGEFYAPCLARSHRYDRAVGYFRSSLFLMTGEQVIDFARSKGVIRMVCSPMLTAADAEAIAYGYSTKDAVVQRLESEIEELLASVDASESLTILATLIQTGTLDIRIAIRPDGSGIFHEKLGIFVDKDQNRVSFKGSSNETWSGWHPDGNVESFEVFCSWLGRSEEARVDGHTEYFDRLWDNRVLGVETIPFPDTARMKLIRVAAPSLDKLPRPAVTSRVPFDHQLKALDQWRLQGKRGILEHATGSGKTVTALLALKDHLEHGLPGLILVPSRLLLDQWTNEIRQDLPNATVLKVGAGNDRWKNDGRIEAFSSPEGFGQRLILATLQTASSDTFRSRIKAGDHLMLVADEVHQTGSIENSNVMEINAGPRLGLSATPRRSSDAEGTARIFSYFGPIIEPPFTLTDAIKAGRLVKYEYHPHRVSLTQPEADEWTEFTKRIVQEAARLGESDLSRPGSERLKLLLIQRSRIAKKARNKVNLAVSVLRNRGSQSERWLVYCEDSDQLGLVKTALADAGIDSQEYHTGMDGDQASSLSWFKQFGGVLVAIRCLDEGVDIPEVSHALILASSQNPRQFIQRRGRVLRISSGKSIAVIHDALVVPDNIELDPNQLSLTRSEIRRAMEFAESAINRSALADLREIAMDVGVNAYQTDEGLEEDTNAQD